MNSVLGNPQDRANVNDRDDRLSFFKRLQAVTNKIHATGNLDEIILELPQEICELFNCDRITLYSVSDDKAFIVSKIKTGLNSFSTLGLPISDKSIAGYAAHFKQTIRISDVYDEAELQSHSPNLHFLRSVDKRTGYRTKQMLVTPLLDAKTNELLGVIQLINNRSGEPFSAIAEEGVKELGATLAIAFSQRLNA